MIFVKTPDVHSVVHFTGCYALVPTIAHLFDINLFPAFGLAVALGLIWEVLDELNGACGWQISWLDWRGADVFDFLTDVAGAGLAWLVFGVF